jgi:3',5'-cyclic AMP phosphodiesterase CpdA
MRIRFNGNNRFKIVQFTDIHWTDGNESNQKTQKLMERILEEEQPDLIALTGDTIYGPEVEAPEKALSAALAPIGEAPFLFVFGNHDTEGGVPKEKIESILCKRKGSLFSSGPRDLYGLGNYTVEVLGSDGETAWVLYCLDSGMMNDNIVCEGYDYIKWNQIQWYWEQSSSFRERYPSHKALSFFHIPLMEFHEAWDSGICVGEKNETICSPKQNSGFFSAAMEQGNMRGIFVGHDHINDFDGDLYGIRLVYGRATGHNTYGKDGFPRGARVIELSEGCDSFRTWLRLEDGNVSGGVATAVKFQTLS